MARGWYYIPFFYLFVACALLCLKKNQSTPRPSEHPPVMGVVPFFLSFLFCFCSCCSCSRWSFVDVPLIFSCPAGRPRTRLATTYITVLGIVEARSVNVKTTIQYLVHNNRAIRAPCYLIYSK